MNRVALALLLALALVLSACGGSGPSAPASGLSGTVFAPSGGDVMGTTVIACLPLGDDACDPQSKTTDITRSGPSAPYSFDGLEAGSYIVVAFKDGNGNAQADDGDFYGESSSVTPPATGVNVTMQVVGEGGSGGGGGGGGGGGNPPPTGGAVFPDLAEGTNGDAPILLSDAVGTRHLLYTAITADSSGIYPVRYGTCSADCSSQAGWVFVTVGDVGFWGGHAQFALDEGRPRVLYFNSETVDDDGRFVYTSCDDTCTNPANWTSETLDVPRPVSYQLDDTPYFALAPDGTPAFVYVTQSGTYYAYRSGGRWEATRLDEGGLFNVSLAFTSASQPRMVFHYTVEKTVEEAGEDITHVAYLECSNKTCQDYAFANLPATAGYRTNAVLRLNAGDAPRILNYAGETLQYLWCDAACADAARWSVTPLGTAKGYGEDGIDLVLDGAGRPHISYGDDFTIDLLYGFCSAACESGNPSWRLGLLVESSDAVTMDVAPPLPNCGSGQTPFSYWYAGNVPSVTLNGGEPNFAYQVRSLQGCDGKLVGEGPSIVRFSNAPPTIENENAHASLEPLRQLQSAATKRKVQ